MNLSGQNKSFKKPGAVIIEGHVQGLSNTRSLGEAGIPVFVVDKTNCVARYSIYCTKFFKCPDFILEEFADFLVDLAVKEKIKDWVLMPSNDHAVYTISRHKTRLKNYYKVITPDLAVINNIYDKAKLLEIAKKNNIPVPITQLFKSNNEPLVHGLDYPVITKGRNGLSFYKLIGKKALLANNVRQFKDQLSLIDQKYDLNYSITQELIPDDGDNKTISFTAFCINGEIITHWSGVKLREHPVRFGTATFTKSMYNEVCHKQSILLLKVLNYTGVCEVEYLRDPRTREYKLIEINPRTWLWVGLAKKCGVDYTKMIYNYVNGHSIYFSKSNEQEEYWINSITDTFYSILNILKGKLNPLAYFRSIFIKNKVHALFVRGDMKPGWMYLFNIPKLLRQR